MLLGRPRFAASSNSSSSAARPKNPNSPSAAAPTNRPGNGIIPGLAAATHCTSTVGTGSGSPFSSSAPTDTNSCAAWRPTTERSTSVVRI